jgi:hypothetical protein
MTDPSSRQRKRPTLKSLQLSDSNKDLVLSSRWLLCSKTDWPTDRRSNVTLTLTYTSKLSKFEFLTSFIKLIAFLKYRKIKVLVEGVLRTSRKIAAGAPQGSVLAPVMYGLYINDTPAATGTHLSLFADDTRIYATEKHERRVLCKVQRGLTAVNSWRESWNLRQEDDMETPYRKDCSHGLTHVHKVLFFIQKWAFKYKYKTYGLRSSHYVSYGLRLFHLRVCSAC